MEAPCSGCSEGSAGLTASAGWFERVSVTVLVWAVGRTDLPRGGSAGRSKLRDYRDLRFAMPVRPLHEVGRWVCVSGFMGEVGTG